MTRSILGVFVALALFAVPAHADPLLRFGMTFGVDRNIPEAHEFGPMVGVGANAGRFSAEANYAYLSMFADDARVHRAGVALRMDIARWWSSLRESRAM